MELCVVFQSPEKSSTKATTAAIERESSIVEGNKSILRIPSR
jgi:hypothetical protein